MSGFENTHPTRRRRRRRSWLARLDTGLLSALLIPAGLLVAIGISASAYAVQDGSSVGLPQNPAGENAAGPVTQAGCPPGFVLDFAGLPAGTILTEQYASFGIHISAIANGDHPDAIIVFDSNAPPTHDPDLAVDMGNIAILAKNLADDSPVDGLVDDPDENNSGGAQIYTFDQPMHVGSFFFIDKDHGAPDKAIAYDASNEVITTVPISVAGSGSVQTINVNADNVRRLEIVYRDSAGLTGIMLGCPPPTSPTPTPTPIPTPTPTPTPTSPTPTPTPTATPDPTPTPTPTVFPVTLPPTGGHPGPPS